MRIVFKILTVTISKIAIFVYGRSCHIDDCIYVLICIQNEIISVLILGCVDCYSFYSIERSVIVCSLYPDVALKIHISEIFAFNITFCEIECFLSCIVVDYGVASLVLQISYVNTSQRPFESEFLVTVLIIPAWIIVLQ